MNIVFWVIQSVLALVFLVSGSLKLTQPKEKLAARMTWTEDASEPMIKLLGAVEILGALGIILPSVTGILPSAMLSSMLSSMLLQYLKFVMSIHMNGFTISILLNIYFSRQHGGDIFPQLH